MNKRLLKKDHYKIFDVNTVELNLDEKVGKFYQIDAPNWAIVIAEVDGKLLCVEQFRFGIEAMTLEFPGGVVDDGEDEVAGGLRELVEETGYRGEAVEIGRFKSNPAIMTNDCVVVLVKNAELVASQQLDEHEAIDIRLMSIDKIDAAISDGLFCNAIHIAAYHVWLKLKEK